MGYFASELFFLLVAGVILLVVSRLIKRQRLDGEESSFFEKLMLACGLLAVLTSLLLSIFRSDLLGDSKEQESQNAFDNLQDYKNEGFGCSEPKDKLKEFKPNA